MPRVDEAAPNVEKAMENAEIATQIAKDNEASMDAKKKEVSSLTKIEEKTDDEALMAAKKKEIPSLTKSMAEVHEAAEKMAERMAAAMTATMAASSNGQGEEEGWRYEGHEEGDESEGDESEESEECEESEESEAGNGRITQLKSDLKNHENDKRAAIDARAEATAIRNKEKAVFDKNIADNTANIAESFKATAAILANSFPQSTDAEVLRKVVNAHGEKDMVAFDKT